MVDAPAVSYLKRNRYQGSFAYNSFQFNKFNCPFCENGMAIELAWMQQRYVKPFNMKSLFFCTTVLLSHALHAQSDQSVYRPVSVGTRNTLSAFNSDAAAGKGIGGQMRIQLSNRFNTEWYLDWIQSQSSRTARNDYHIGWSLLYYPGQHTDFSRLLQPYLIAGHCFDKTQVFEQGNRSNQASRWSMATQAGLGTHININPRFDCSLSGQYMLHFGKEIEATDTDGKLRIAKADHSHLDGHLLFTVSFNYKLFNWKKLL